MITQHEPEVTGAGREEVVSHGLLDRHSGVEQDSEVTQLVGELLAEDGQAHGDASQDGLGEGSSWKCLIGFCLRFLKIRSHQWRVRQ